MIEQQIIKAVIGLGLFYLVLVGYVLFFDWYLKHKMKKFKYNKIFMCEDGE